MNEGIHIVFLGKANVGKSSLMNALANDTLSAVSATAGSTTDLIKIPMKLQPFGPVVLLDTVPIENDENIEAIADADFGIVVIDSTKTLSDHEKNLLKFLDKSALPYLIAANKIENGVNPELLKELKLLKKSHFEISCKENAGIVELKTKLTRLLPIETTPPMLSDIVNQGDFVVLVVPMELDNPGGRLIMPYIQAIRESLDEDTVVVVSKDKELRAVMNGLKYEPEMVIADSSIITKVAAEIPEHIKLTTFSILMARHKGDLPVFIRSIKAIDQLKDGDKVLIAEACCNHSDQDDLGRVKIPNWLKKHTNKNLVIDVKCGELLPKDVTEYSLVVHCSGCNISRHLMQTRIKQARLRDIPIVSYGVILSYLQGAFPRVLLPFEEAVSEWKKRSKHSVLQV